jgi:hypothetical protein
LLFFSHISLSFVLQLGAGFEKPSNPASLPRPLTSGKPAASAEALIDLLAAIALSK